MNVVIYARYSSDRQTEQSIEGQLKECYEYAQRNCYTVVSEYIASRPGVKFCASDFRQSQEWRWKAGRILA